MLISGKVRADCPLLGFTLSNTTTPSPPNHLEQNGNGKRYSLSLRYFSSMMHKFLLVETKGSSSVTNRGL
jgi:hypothetical protein